MKKISLIRYGKFNTNHKEFYGKEDSYHSPPLKKGLYVFYPNFIEPFLYLWKENEQTGKLKQIKIVYSGKIWTHVYHNHPEIKYYQNIKSWYETDTNSIQKIFKIEVHCLMKGGTEFVGEFRKNNYKRTTFDHLELFINKP